MKRIKESVLQAITELNLEDATDQEILRIAISAEQSAINLYNILARASKHSLLKKVLLDIAKEEKVHIGEFHAVLDRVDSEEVESQEAGYEEVIDIETEVTINEITLHPGQKIKVWSKK